MLGLDGIPVEGWVEVVVRMRRRLLPDREWDEVSLRILCCFPIWFARLERELMGQRPCDVSALEVSVFCEHRQVIDAQGSDGDENAHLLFDME